MSSPDENENPLMHAAYWKRVLDKHIGGAIGQSVSSFQQKSNDAVIMARACADHLDHVAEHCTRARFAGALMIAGGLASAIFTAGATLPLVAAGAGVTLALSAAVVKGLNDRGWAISDTNRACDATSKIVDTIKDFEVILTHAVYAFTRAKKYLQTEEGQHFFGMLKKATINIDDVRSSKANVNIVGMVYPNVDMMARNIFRTQIIADFISVGNFSKADIEIAVANIPTAVMINDQYVTMVKSSGIRALSADHDRLVSLLVVWSIILGVIEMTSVSKTGAEIRELAKIIETTTTQLLVIYRSLTN